MKAKVAGKLPVRALLLNGVISLGVAALLAGVIYFSYWFASQNARRTRDGSPDRVVADRAWEAEDWKTAADQYEQMLRADPYNPTARFRRSYSLHEIFYEALEAGSSASPITATTKQLAQVALDSYDATLDFLELRDLAYYNIACIYARLGEADRAIEAIRKAIANGASISRIARDSDFESLKSDPRFARIVESAADDNPNGFILRAF
jgi:tetratricopeptide (TPR) repeat protein